MEEMVPGCLLFLKKNLTIIYKNQKINFLIPIKKCNFALDLSKQRLERARVMAN